MLNPHIVAQFNLRTEPPTALHVGVVAVLPRLGDFVALPGKSDMYEVDGVVHDLRFEKEACSGKLFVNIWVTPMQTELKR